MPKSHYLMQFFNYEHLPDHLQEVSKPFGQLAESVIDLRDRVTGDNPEITTCLRKLLEAKDCAVRSLIYKGE